MTSPIEAFLEALERSGAAPRPDRTGWSFLCPVHGEKDASAHVSEGTRGQAVVAMCHACGASYADIADAIGVDATIGRTEYVYTDASGSPVAIRFRKGSGKGKRMGWLAPDGTPGKPEEVGPLLYRLPELLASPTQDWVFIVEGEKDVETLRHLGFTATTPGGATDGWRPEWNRHILGHPIVLLPDNDEPGEEFAQRIAGALDSIPSVKIVHLPVEEKEDVTDWVRQGGTAAALRKMVEREPEWDPLEQDATSIILEDAQMAERFLAWTTGDLHYIEEEDPTARPWLHWSGARWEKVGPAWAENYVWQFGLWFAERAKTEPRSKVRKEMELGFKKLSRVGVQKSVLRAALGMPGTMVRTNALDQDLNLLGVQNGVIDLRHGRLLPPDRSRLITKTTPVPYDPYAQAPVWAAFLNTVFKGDAAVIEYVQRAIGYTLTGLQDEQVFFMPYGEGANGKTKFITAIQHMMGDYAGQAETRMLMQVRERGVPDDIHALIGKRLVAATETAQGKHLDVARVKWLTGGDALTSRPLHGKYVTYTPTYKLWLLTNHLPSADGTDPAYWRRVRLIPFDVRIPDAEQDGGLAEKLAKEATGILAWAVRGAVEWRRSGLQEPAAIIQATEAYRQSMDVVGGFLEDMTTEDPAAKVAMADLYGAFVEWFTSSNPGREKAFIMDVKRFGSDLEKKGHPPERGAKGVAIRRGLVLRRTTA